MSEKKSTGIYEGPIWNNYKEQYDNDFTAFRNGIEMQNYLKSKSGVAYIKNQTDVDLKIQKNVEVVKGLKVKDNRLEKLTALGIKQKDVKQMTIDLDKLNSADFTSKYKVMKEQFKKANNNKN